MYCLLALVPYLYFKNNDVKYKHHQRVAIIQAIQKSWRKAHDTSWQVDFNKDGMISQELSSLRWAAAVAGQCCERTIFWMFVHNIQFYG